MKNELIEKYNIPVPRYTSYPPANYFHTDFTATDYLQAIEESNHQQPATLSLHTYSILQAPLLLLRMQLIRYGL